MSLRQQVLLFMNILDNIDIDKNSDKNSNKSNNKNRVKLEWEVPILLLSVTFVGLCTIIYELLIGSISTYFLGDSIKQFSITLGLVMFSMGLGTYLSRLFRTELILTFIGIEILLALIGGLCVPFLYFAFTFSEIYYPAMLLLILLVGILIGLEIPLLTRILERYYPLKINISNVLAFDYFGALLATLLFPFVFLPFLGLFNASLVTGLLNLLVALLNLFWFRKKLGKKVFGLLRNSSLASFFILFTFICFSENLIYGWESSLYRDSILLSKQSKFQKVVLTKSKDDLRLFLNGGLQFSSLDEYRYHEGLIHIPINLIEKKEKVLILGGGDGLAVRELLKYSKQVKKIVLVDLDPLVVELARNNRFLRELNQASLNSNKVTIFHEDAFKFLEDNTELYDLIIADLPDPSNTSLSRMYTKEFYNLIQKRLSRSGIFVTQSTSPYYSSEAFWCINQTLRTSKLKYVYPYHIYIPSFGDWGYNLAANDNLESKIKNSLSSKIKEQEVSLKLRFLSAKLVKPLFIFSKDLQNQQNLKTSSLNEPKVLDYYLKGWKKYH